MTTKYSLIKQAHAAQITRHTLTENIAYLATTHNITDAVVCESISHVLAGLAQNPRMMHPNSIAALMAGLEKLSGGLMSSADDAKKQHTMQTLIQANLKQSLPNNAVVTIAEFGARFPDLVQKYAAIVKSPNELPSALNKLRSTIERAMQVSKESNKVSDNPASMGSAGMAAQRTPSKNTPPQRSSAPTMSQGEQGQMGGM